MIKIVIIDDQIFWLERLEKEIIEVLNKLGCKGQIQTMTNAQTLLDEYQEGNCFDLLFIDIEMGEIDGIQLGEKIRALGDDRVKMAYISAFPELGYQAINNDVIGFIDKANCNKSEIERIINKALKKLNKEIKYYVFYQDRKKRSIDIEKILYFFKEGRRVGMRVLDQGQYNTLWISSNLKGATKDLNDNFLQIRQNVVIQRFYGKDLGAYQVQMDDGETFEVGRNFRKDFWGVGK